MLLSYLLRGHSKRGAISMVLIRRTVCGFTMIFFFLKFFLFLNFMLILGHDSVFSMTVASTRTRSFLEKIKRNNNVKVHRIRTSLIAFSFAHTLGTLPQRRAPGSAMGSHAAQTDLELPLHPRSDSDLILLPLLPVQESIDICPHLVYKL